MTLLSLSAKTSHVAYGSLVTMTLVSGIWFITSDVSVIPRPTAVAPSSSAWAGHLLDASRPGTKPKYSYGLCSYGLCSHGLCSYIVMAYVVMAYVLTAYVVMAYVVI